MTAPEEPKLITGKQAEFVLSHYGEPTVLRARSAANPGHSYLYQKKDKQFRITRYVCSRCFALKKSRKTGTKMSIMRLDEQKRYMCEADSGHDVLCEPYKDVEIGARNLKRKAYAELRSGAGGKRVKAAHDLLVAKTGYLAMQEGVSLEEAAAALPNFKSFLSGGHRNQKKGTATIEAKFGTGTFQPKPEDAQLNDFQRFKKRIQQDTAFYERWHSAIRDLVARNPNARLGTQSGMQECTHYLVDELRSRVPEFPADFESIEYFVKSFKIRQHNVGKQQRKTGDKPCGRCTKKFENEDYKLAIIPRALAESDAFQTLCDMDNASALYALQSGIYQHMHPPPPPLPPAAPPPQPMLHEQPLALVFDQQPQHNPTSIYLHEIFKDLSAMSPQDLRRIAEAKLYYPPRMDANEIE